MPLVSIIVPNFNHAKYLPQRLDSIFNQTFQDFEVILLDDLSTDDSVEVLSLYAKHPKVSHFIVNQTNSGSPFIQWNKGVNLAKGDIIWVAESDDVAESNFLAQLVPVFQTNKNTGLAYCQSHRYNDRNEITANWLHYTEDLDDKLFLKSFSMIGLDYIKKFLIHKNTIPNASAVLFTKEIFTLAGGADEKIRTCSDWLTWLKILTYKNVYYNPLILNYHRYHDSSVVASVKKNVEQITYFELQSGWMRITFNEFLKNNMNVEEENKTIIELNNFHLMNIYGFEGISQLKRGFWAKGLSNIFRAISYIGLSFRFLKQAKKKMRRT